MKRPSDPALHHAFRAALHALATPGAAKTIPGAGDTSEAVALLLESTWEPHARPLVLDTPVPVDSLRMATTGTRLEPEKGDTVLIVVHPGAPMTDVVVSGPGIADRTRTTLPLSHDAVLARAHACRDFPTGIDLLFVGAGPVVVGLPRTTRIEVLA